MVLPKLSPEALSALPAEAQTALQIAAGTSLGLPRQVQAVLDARAQHVQALSAPAGPSSVNLPPPAQAAYDSANQLTHFNSSNPNVTHDANGNLTSLTDATGTTLLTWDARNRLIGVNGPGLIATFQYDALGRRISKTFNGETTQFLYDGRDIISEIQGGASSATYLRSLTIDEAFVRHTPAGNEYYHSDDLASVLAVTNDTATVKAQATYEPFGQTTITGTTTQPLWFTGRELNAEGLYFYRARYYSPMLHRFLGEDPVGFLAGDFNLYAYVRSNPINRIDPEGTMPRLPPGIRGMPPRAPVGPQVRPNPTPPFQSGRPQIRMPSPPGKDLVPEPPWWMRVLRRILSDDDYAIIVLGGRKESPSQPPPTWQEQCAADPFCT